MRQYVVRELIGIPLKGMQYRLTTSNPDATRVGYPQVPESGVAHAAYAGRILGVAQLAETEVDRHSATNGSAGIRHAS